MRIRSEAAERLMKFLDASETALDAMTGCLCGRPDCANAIEIAQHRKRHQYANQKVAQAIKFGDTRRVMIDPSRRDQIEQVIREGGSHRAQEIHEVLIKAGFSPGSSLAMECERFLAAGNEFDAVLRHLLEESQPAGTEQTNEAGEELIRMQVARAFRERRGQRVPLDDERILPAIARRLIAAGLSDEMTPSERAAAERSGAIGGVINEPANSPQKTTRILTDRLLGRLILDTSCDGFGGFPNLRWRIEVLAGGHSGYLVQPSWDGFDADTGESDRINGGKFYVSQHAADNEIVQAMLRSVLAAAEHEIREAFRFRGVPIYRPHQPLEALREFTASHPAEVREDPETTQEAAGK